MRKQILLHKEKVNNDKETNTKRTESLKASQRRGANRFRDKAPFYRWLATLRHGAILQRETEKN